MKKTNFVKILALTLCAVMMVGLLAGCGEKESPDQTQPKHDPTPVGMLVLSCNATVQITYDGSGFSQKVEGTDENGKAIVSQYQDNEPIGVSCVELVADLLRKAITSGYVPTETPNVVIKQAHGAALPSETFLEDITKAAKELMDEIPVVTIKAEDLDENGYITEAAARILLQLTLGLNSPETVRVVGEMEDEQYTFVAIVGGRQNMYSVHAVTGQVVGIIVQEPDIFNGYYEERPDTNEDIIPDMYWEEYVEVPEEPVPEVTEGE